MREAKSAIWILITATRGSAPRDAGTAMQVTATGIAGTIGGGALEHRAIATARRILAHGGAERTETIPLGPGLGQCCGGAVILHYSYTPRPVDAATAMTPPRLPNCLPKRPLWLWGAGHVGRAVVQAAPAQAFEITWIDTNVARFPTHVPPDVTQMPAADMPLLAASAPRSAHHLIFTYAHDIDLALCAALLRRGAASIGVIGSATKWSRFSKRLAAMNLDPRRIACPIGDKKLGKAPHQIAHGVIHSLLAVPAEKVCP